MGIMRTDPKFENKVKRLYVKLRNEYPRRGITITKITANIEFDEQKVEKALLERKRRGNRYFY